MPDILSGIGAATSVFGAIKGSEAQDAATDAQNAQIALQREQYERWQEIYGPVEENLADFYGKLTPAQLLQPGIQKLNEEQVVNMNNLKRQFAQDDLSRGAQTEMKQDLAMDYARERAAIRARAPLAVAEAQSQFLGIGKGIVNPYSSSLSNALGNQATTQSNLASQYGSAAGTAFQNVWDYAKTNNLFGTPTTTPAPVIEGSANTITGAGVDDWSGFDRGL